MEASSQMMVHVREAYKNRSLRFFPVIYENLVIMPAGIKEHELVIAHQQLFICGSFGSNHKID